MTNWKKNLGSAFSSAGSMLVGIGVVPQLASAPNKLLLYIALTGLVFNVIGTFFTHLFAQEQAEAIQVSQATQSPVPPPPTPSKP